MSIKCPQCSSWTRVKETRTRKTDGVVTRRYECANLHRFTTEERVKENDQVTLMLPAASMTIVPAGFVTT